VLSLIDHLDYLENPMTEATFSQDNQVIEL
jgi:hypothetical protein